VVAGHFLLGGIVDGFFDSVRQLFADLRRQVDMDFFARKHCVVTDKWAWPAPQGRQAARAAPAARVWVLVRLGGIGRFAGRVGRVAAPVLAVAGIEVDAAVVDQDVGVALALGRLWDLMTTSSFGLERTARPAESSRRSGSVRQTGKTSTRTAG
jgi:hypothetical protein